MSAPIRIAMWSGPRNLSTAMMRSFGARADCAVSDEPFYGAYLALTGIDHPMREEVLAAEETDAAKVAAALGGDAPGGAALWYQKHMVQHMVSGVPRDWFSAVRHAVLIRHPAFVAASFDAKYADPTPEDLGTPQMDGVIADIERITGRTPPVIEAEDVRRDPEGMLKALCAALEIPFDPAMTSWPAGRRETDGVWGAHWYGAVGRSTGFAPPADPPEVEARLKPLVEGAMPGFEALRARKLKPVK
ncbi:MAG: HAD family hydrolase [Pseudomonadota bacterium]